MRTVHFALGLAAIAAGQGAAAQPADLPIAPATSSTYPAGFKVMRTGSGPVYATKDGHVLYGMDMRTLIRFGPDPAVYCQQECQKIWQPMLAEPGTKPNIEFPRDFAATTPPSGQASRASANSRAGAESLYNPQRAPDWTVVEGANGPQWVYKGWHLVFIRKGDKPGSTAFDGVDSLTWNTLKFRPPLPTITAPQTVATAFLDGDYVLTRKDGRALFTGSCRKDCTEWQPLGAPAAGRGIGEWTVSRSGDTPQWLYRGKPVFVGGTLDAPRPVPANGKVLRP